MQRQLSWCQQQNLRVIGGPLIQLDSLSLPPFAYDLADDYDRFEAAAIHYAQTAVARFRDRVDIWVCAARSMPPVPSRLMKNRS